MSEAANPPSRCVIRAEAHAWLAQNPAAPGTSVVTSLPDVSELPDLGFEGWRGWFLDTARRVLRWTPADGGAVFFQSDVRHSGAWVDKGYLVTRAAEDEGATLLWHKVVCRTPPGTATYGRSSYAHMLCFARRVPPGPARPRIDVMPDGGHKSWSRAMGAEACRAACAYLRDELGATTIVDPFCGRGTALAIANALGLSAIGVDLADKRCRAARRLVLA